MSTPHTDYRSSIREDNADLRLTETGRRLGIVDDARWHAFCEKRAAIERESQRLDATRITPADAPDLQLARDATLAELLRRPELGYAQLMALPGIGPGVADEAVAEQLEIAAKYAGYIRRQEDEIARQLRSEETRLPADLEYENVRGLSIEVRQKLKQHRPMTLGQAARISGVTPAAVSLLLVHLKRSEMSRDVGRA